MSFICTAVGAAAATCLGHSARDMPRMHELDRAHNKDPGRTSISIPSRDIRGQVAQNLSRVLAQGLWPAAEQLVG
jgi:hypothetical protein